MVYKDSISMQLVREALYQCPGTQDLHARWLADLGIDRVQWQIPEARVPALLYARLWRAVARHTDDEFFGMDPRPLRSGSLAFMCRMAMAQPTLQAALEAVLDFLALMLAQVRGQLHVHHSLAQIALPEPEPEPEQGAKAAPRRRAFTCFTFWLIVHGIACWLVDRRLPVLAVEVCGPIPAYCDDYRTLFSENIRFDRPLSRLIFAADCLALPVRRGEADLQRFLARAPGNILVRYRDPSSLGQKLRRQLAELPAAQWPEIAVQARSLGLSESTLRRRLSDEGQTWQMLKDSVRRERAVAWLSEEGTSLADIALQLGFADLSSFYKAFRKWTGASPGHYRDLLLNDVS